jgi:hypothetical protein
VPTKGPVKCLQVPAKVDRDEGGLGLCDLGPRVVRIEACLSIRCKGAVPSLTGSGIDKGWSEKEKKGYSVPGDVSVSVSSIFARGKRSEAKGG